MGLIGYVVGAGRAAERIGGAVGGVAEVFVGNAAERDQADLDRIRSTLDEFRGEFDRPAGSAFDRFVGALNRLPRPLLAISTLALFAYAMADPEGFSERMVGLNLVPEPLWWLLGAVVSFYFGARELHHYRSYLETNSTRETVTDIALSGVRGRLRGQAEPVSGPEDRAPLLGSLLGPVSYGRSGREPAVEVRAADPDFNAALEEWRARQSGR
jgi:hypothetical protein